MENKDKDKNFKQNKNKQYKRLFINFISNYFNVALVFLVICIFIASYILVLKPKYDKVSTVIAERYDFKFQNQTMLENNLETINEYKRSYNQINKDTLEKINIILPSFETTEEFFTMFEEMVLKRGYLITNLAVSSDSD